MKPSRVLILFSLALLGCVSTSTTTMTTPMSSDAESWIRDAGQRFAGAFNRSDWDTVAAFYADDAAILAPNEEIVRGPAGARQLFSGFAAMRPRLAIMNSL